jgi:hypothetical protein
MCCRRTRRRRTGRLVDVSEEFASSPVFFAAMAISAEMVMGELAGRFEAPLYGMFAVQDKR